MVRFATIATLALAFAGCANHEGVTPSQNPSLQAVSPSTTSASEGGAMQKSLDSWLKEEWAPMTTKKEVTTSTTAADGTVTTKTEIIEVPEPEDNEPFTLQKYADKWKTYHENKAKANEGKPAEPSHIETISTLPVIGK